MVNTARVFQQAVLTRHPKCRVLSPFLGGARLLVLRCFYRRFELIIAAAIVVLELLAAGCQSRCDTIPNVQESGLAALDIDQLPDADHPELAPEPDARFASMEISDEEHETTSTGIVTLTLEQAISISLDHNPDLVAARAAEPVARAAFHVADTYPFNPQFQTQLAPYNRDQTGADGSVAQQHVLLQNFELAGQQGYRSSVAASNYQQVDAAICQVELATAAQTMRLYFTALYRRELQDLAESLAALNEQMVGVIQRRLTAGEASAGDVTLARLQAASARRQQSLAAGAYQTALSELRSHLNLGPEATIELATDWADWQWQAIDESMLPQVLAERPDIVAARAAVAGAEANLALAQAARVPDLQIGPMWERDEAATEFWGLQAQIDIPLVNTGRPLVRQRQAELCESQIRSSRLEEKSLLQATTAVQRYERARVLWERSRGDLGEEVQHLLQPVENQFKAGQVTLLEVFAARSVLIESRQSLLDLFNELAQAAADVTETTGLSPQELLSSGPQAAGGREW